MRSHGRNNKRNRGNKSQPEEHFLAAEADDFRPATGTVSHHSEFYGESSRSGGRGSYEMNRDHSSSRRHHHTGSWHRRSSLDDDKHSYASSDGYRHQGGPSREDFEPPETGDADVWSTRPKEHRYPHAQDDWHPRYGPPYPSSSYAESSSWPKSHEQAASSYDNWPLEEYGQEEYRNGARDGRQYRESRDSSRWHHEQRREKGAHKFQSDSGWSTRRKTKSWGEQREQQWSNTAYENGRAVAGDSRSWEPAASWRSSHSNVNQTDNRDNPRVNHSNKNYKGGKRGPNAHRQKRDWRNDDGLNNWRKRDSSNLNDSYKSSDGHNKAPVRRKHPLSRSPSPSRSRSPAGSYRSFHSSRGFSRSPSLSPRPKRQRRDSNSIRTPSPAEPEWIPEPRRGARYSPRWTPDYERGRPIHSRQNEFSPRMSSQNRSQYGRKPYGKAYGKEGMTRRSLPSPEYVMDPERGEAFPPRPGYSPCDSPRSLHRGRSASSASSMSTSRSQSASPMTKPRTVHRLPTPSLPMSPTAGANRIQPVKSPSSRHLHGQTNGKYGRKGQRDKNGSGSGVRTNITSMPPPSTIPVAHKLKSDNAPMVTSLSEKKFDIPAAPRLTPVKNAGFKPIGTTSSAVKKFFPNDDDDAETPPDLPTKQLPFGHPLLAPSSSNQHERPSIPSPASLLNPPSPTQHTEVTSSSYVLSVEDTKPLSNDGDAVTRLVPETHEELYNIISQVGEGTFGKVYKAENTASKVFVALKRIRMESERDGFPVTAMREIKLLQSLRHPNVVQLHEMLVSNGSVYMVFEYMDHDLTGVLSQTQFVFTDAHLKSLCFQMLRGLAYLHHKGVIHRDIKGSNILVNNRGELKLADFGLARFYQKRRRSDYTNRVITLWYRPPELLFGATVYGPEVDMWSAGCIMLELFTKKPVFQGNDEIHQLDVIYKIIGTPTSDRWRGVMDLPWHELIKPKDTIPNHFRELFQKWMSPAALDLAELLLAYDPSQRITAVQALDAPYFTQEAPEGVPPVGLATLEGEWHELETKRERAKKRRKPETTIIQ